MSNNPYDQSSKEMLKESIIKRKAEEGYSDLAILEYLDLQSMFEEMEL